jgi:two-component system CheB/CheR fusion protein
VQAGRKEQVEREIEGVDRRGRTILCRVRVSSLLDEQEGNHGLVLVFQDITEERRKEEYGRYLGRILGRALNEIYFLDPVSLRFTLANEGAQQKLGYEEQRLLQMTFPEILAGDAASNLRTTLVPLLNGTRSEIVFETTIRSAEREYPAEICMQYFANEHPPILLAIVHETSERQQLDPV